MISPDALPKRSRTATRRNHRSFSDRLPAILRQEHDPALPRGASPCRATRGPSRQGAAWKRARVGDFRGVVRLLARPSSATSEAGRRREPEMYVRSTAFTPRQAPIRAVGWGIPPRRPNSRPDSNSRPSALPSTISTSTIVESRTVYIWVEASCAVDWVATSFLPRRHLGPVRWIHSRLAATRRTDRRHRTPTAATGSTHGE